MDISFGYFGASVRGPRHTLQNMPNQDAWLGGVKRRYAFVVVCDGMGSGSKSDVGARMACLATRDALNFWSRSSDNRIENLLRLIKQLWEIRIAPHPLREFATTCLFAAMVPDRGLIVSGLGDGIALVTQPGHPINIVIERNSDFANETVALGTVHRLSDWRYQLFPNNLDDIIVMLATDGIADDLRQDSLSELPSWILRKYGDLPAYRRFLSLRSELRNWPTPGHQDDKTLAIFYGKSK